MMQTSFLGTTPFKGGAWTPPAKASRAERDAARRAVARLAVRRGVDPVADTRAVLAALGLDTDDPEPQAPSGRVGQRKREDW